MTTIKERIEHLRSGPKVTAAQIEDGALHLKLATGATVSVPARQLRVLSSLSDEQISDVHLVSGGTVLLWAQGGVSLAVEALLEAVTGLQTLKSAQRKGGSTRSEAKVGAVCANGAKGGRARKTPVASHA